MQKTRRESVQKWWCNMKFYDPVLNMFRIKFQVLATWSQASPLEHTNLISRRPATRFLVGFFCSKDTNGPHILTLLSLNLDEIWSGNIWNTPSICTSYHHGNRRHWKTVMYRRSVVYMHRIIYRTNSNSMCWGLLMHASTHLTAYAEVCLQ